jgi:hypothetical protein
VRNYQSVKTLKDFETIDPPDLLSYQPVVPEIEDLRILRMLVRPKYGALYIPEVLKPLQLVIHQMIAWDKYLTGIDHSWVYVTVRSGICNYVTDDEWHFDGASFRTDIIPERNYVWVSHYPFQYKTGKIEWPADFDPNKHNLFTYASRALEDKPIRTVMPKNWYLVSPFVLHRRDPASNGKRRTFIRISFPDIEGRDINNTENPMLSTPFFGRDPVKSFRNNLVDYNG